MLQILQHPPNQRQIEGPKSVWRSCENDPTLKVAVNSEWDVIGLYKAKLAEEMMESEAKVKNEMLMESINYDEETAMKPYIEKNDGVPDNNRYSEALEAAKETVEALNKLTDQALAQYTALVDSAVAGHITDERELEHIMDGLLDFGDDLRFLEIYKRLCRHIFYKHLQMVGEHIYLWRMQFDTKDEEDENE